MVKEKNNFFSQMHNTVLQRLKQFLNVKMISLEKNGIGKVSAPF